MTLLHSIVLSDRQNVNEADRLLAPVLVDDGTYRTAHRFRHRIRIAFARPGEALHRRDHDVEHDLVDDFAGRILLGDADEINLGIVGQFAFFGHGNRNKGAAGKTHSPPFYHGARLGILQNVAVLVEPPRRQLVDDPRVAGPELDQVAVAADQHFWNTGGTRELGVLVQMQGFAMNRYQKLRP